MKFIHAADVHLDSLSTGLRKFYGRDSVSISEATQKAFIALVDLALFEKVDFVLISGDLFDSNWKDYSLGLFFIDEIKRLSCPVYYLRGNHDSENRLLKKLPYPDHLFEISSEKPQTYLIEELKVAIHGQSYSHYHTRDDLSKDYPNSIPGYVNIGLLHTSGDVKLGESPYAPYRTETLLKKGYDYWALGHLHDFQIISESPHIVYSGNVQGRHIKETGLKGCCLISLDEGSSIELDFCPLSQLVWEKIEVDLSSVKNEEDLKNKILAHLKTSFKSYFRTEVQVIVRLQFIGISYLERSLQNDLIHYEHQIHCWLEEYYEGAVYLERVENKTMPYRSMEALKENNPILDQLLGSLDELIQSGETKDYFQNLVNSLKEKAPIEYQKSSLFLNLEDPTRTSPSLYLDRIKGSLHEIFLEEDK